MNKYIAIAFVLMGVAFYEISGGSDFEPGDNSLVVFAEPNAPRALPVSSPAVVARSSTNTSALTDIAPTRAVIEPVTEPEVIAPAARDLEPGVETVGVTDTTESTPDPEPAEQPDLRFVDGDRVNVRGGPGTEYAVVGKLLRNDMVEVLKDEGNGWLHLRDTVTGDEGWIAEWLLTAAN